MALATLSEEGGVDDVPAEERLEVFTFRVGEAVSTFPAWVISLPFGRFRFGDAAVCPLELFGVDEVCGPKSPLRPASIKCSDFLEWWRLNLFSVPGSLAGGVEKRAEGLQWSFGARLIFGGVAGKQPEVKEGAVGRLSGVEVVLVTASTDGVWMSMLSSLLSVVRSTADVPVEESEDRIFLVFSVICSSVSRSFDLAGVLIRCERGVGEFLTALFP